MVGCLPPVQCMGDTSSPPWVYPQAGAADRRCGMSRHSRHRAAFAPQCPHARSYGRCTWPAGKIQQG